MFFPEMVSCNVYVFSDFANIINVNHALNHREDRTAVFVEVVAMS
jgi:hypothetical protein